MSIENLIKILGATLLNTPSITKIDSIENSLNRVKSESLFIAKNQADANIAIELGAYAILCDFDANISDEEIAWLFVDDIEFAIIKIIRFLLIDQKIKALYSTKVEYEILSSIVEDDRVVFLDSDIFENYKKVQNLYKSSIIISKDEKLLQDIYPDFKRVDNVSQKMGTIDIKVVKTSLFLTTLIYENTFYESLQISKLFIDELKNSLKALKYFKINYNLKNIHPKLHFNPIFISDNLNIKNFGDTQRVLIIEEDKDLFEKELNFLKTEARWVKLTTIETEGKNIVDLLQTVGVKNFNIILIKANYNEVIKSLKENSQKGTQLLFTE